MPTMNRPTKETEIKAGTQIYLIKRDGGLHGVLLDGLPTLVAYFSQAEADQAAIEYPGAHVVSHKYSHVLMTCRTLNKALAFSSGDGGMDRIERVMHGGRILYQAPLPLND